MWHLIFRNTTVLSLAMASSLLAWHPAPIEASRLSLVTSASNLVVTNQNGSGPGSLKQAILDANASPGRDTISFSIGSGPQSIDGSDLPFITDPVVIDGTTQPGFAGSPIIEINGGGAGAGFHVSAGNTVIQGLVINRCNIGIKLVTGDGNIIKGNYIGTDLSGAIALGNFNGMQVESSHNQIGGMATGEGNVVSGNRGIGINVFRGNSNQILGNYVGTNASGTVPLANTNQGISLTEGSNNIVGGLTPQERNIISGNNSVGILVSGSSLPNGTASGNQVLGNYIGTNAGGTAALGNRGEGVFVLEALDTVIGGSTPGAGNVISGNAGGVRVTGATRTRIERNYIGTDLTGTTAVANSGDGIVLISASNTLIGGAAGRGNVISGNGLRGIWVFDNSGSGGSQVQGNYIGTQVDGVTALGNGSHGVFVNNVTAGTKVGGANSGEGNVIAFNGGAGVDLETGSGISRPLSGNSVRSNSIFSNNGVGIFVGGEFHTRQSFPTLTAAGANASSTAVQGTLTSSANGTFTMEFFSNTACDPSGFGEGQRFLGAATVQTDMTGNVNFNATLPTGSTAGSFITATVTNADNYTSEFSRCIVAGVAPPTPPLLMTEPNSTRAIALDSVTMVRDPFHPTSANNFSADHRTRVMLFARNVDLAPGESALLTAQAEDSNGTVHALVVEYVGRVPGQDWLTQIVIKLPDNLSTSGDLRVRVTLRGLTSNSAFLSVTVP